MGVQLFLYYKAAFPFMCLFYPPDFVCTAFFCVTNSNLFLMLGVSFCVFSAWLFIHAEFHTKGNTNIKNNLTGICDMDKKCTDKVRRIKYTHKRKRSHSVITHLGLVDSSIPANWTILFEPWHDKTNKMAYAPSEDSDQPGHPPSLIRVFADRMKKPWVLSYPLSTQRKFWSVWADTQADLSLCWAHTHFVGFVMSGLICNS